MEIRNLFPPSADLFKEGREGRGRVRDGGGLCVCVCVRGVYVCAWTYMQYKQEYILFTCMIDLPGVDEYMNINASYIYAY